MQRSTKVMLNYFRPLKFDTYTLSIDNVVCD